MRYGSVCSGIEAATVAWHPLGWEPAFFSEIEKFPREVLAHHYPDVPLHGDFTTITEKEYGSIDLLVGGTPCQSFSVAGLRKGLDDDRGNLALEFIKLAQREKPRWVVWENVPGVLSSNGGRDFGSFLGALGEIGYGFAYRVLDAQYFGVAQRRRRVFVVGYLGDWRRAAAVLFERESLSGNPAPSRKTRQDTSEAVTNGLGVSSGVYEHHGQDSRTKELGEVCTTVTAKYGTGGNNMPIVTARMRAFGDYDCDGTASTVKARDYKDATDLIAYGLPGNWIGRKPENGGNQVEPFYEQSPCQTRTDRHAVAFHENSRAELRETDIAGSMSTAGGKPGQGYPAVRNGMSVRRLTPIECERLQGFPDGYTDVKEKTPDGPRYKAIGNSMAVPVMSWIGQRIDLIDRLI